MITMLASALFFVAFVAVCLSLTDSWLRGRNAYRILKREQALLKAGFIPQVHAHEVRLRQPARHTRSAAHILPASGARPFARRLPLPHLPAAA